MSEIVIISSLVILITLALVFLILWLNQRNKINYLNQKIQEKDIINQASFGGYYLLDKVKKKEIFSSNIYQMFDENNKFIIFNDLASCFADEKDKLIELVDRLSNGFIDHFTVNLEIKNIADNKIISCSGKRIESNNNSLEGVIIWFYDVTDYLNRIYKLNTKTDNLKEKVKSLRGVLDRLPIAIWLKDCNNTITYNNKLYDEMSCFNLENSGINPHEINKTKKINKHVVIDGNRRKFTLYESLIDKKALNKSTLGYAIDVSEQEKIEKDLQLHISAHADLLESSSSSISIYGPDTRLEFYNNAYLKMWDFDEKWLNTKPRYNEVLSNLRDRRKIPEQSDFSKYRNDQIAHFKNLIDTKSDYLYLPNGETYRRIIIPHALGGLLFVHEDMTDSLAMQSSYNSLVKVQKETIDSLNEAVSVYSHDGYIKLFNPQYCQLWGFEEEYLLTNPHRTELFEKCKHLHKFDEEFEAYRDQWLRLPQRDERIKYRTKTAAGKTIEKSIIYLPNGDYLNSFLDITENVINAKKLEESNEELKKADKLKTDFLSIVSHEFRTPLTSIISFSEMLNSESLGKLNEKQKGYVDAVIYSANELSNLTSDIIDITSMEIENIAFEVQEFDIIKAADAVIKSISLRADASNIRIRVNCPRDIGKMVGDENRIRQIIYNIASNSIKFSKNGQEVKMDIYEQEGDKIIFKFTDNGIGIARTDKSRIFDKFFKADSSKKICNASSGIGLTVVKTLLDLHNGQIIVESEENQGAIFYCIFDRRNEKLVKLLENENKNQ